MEHVTEECGWEESVSEPTAPEEIIVTIAEEVIVAEVEVSLSRFPARTGQPETWRRR